MIKVRERRFAVLAPHAEAREAIPASPRFRTFERPSDELLSGWTHIFVLVSLGGLGDVSQFVRTANRRHRLCAVLVDRGSGFDLLPSYLHSTRVRTLRNMLVHSGPALPRRVLNAYRIGAEDDLIADAQVAGDDLFLVSCASEALRISMDRVPALRGMSAEARCDLRVADDGAYVHWRAADVHLDLDSIRCTLDPALADRQRLQALLEEGLVGGAIARIRKRAGLKQRDIPGLSARQVRRIEKGQGTTLSAMERLAAAHGMELGEYADEVARVASGSGG